MARPTQHCPAAGPSPRTSGTIAAVRGKVPHDFPLCRVVSAAVLKCCPVENFQLIGGCFLFLKKNPNIVFPPSLYAFGSKPLALLFGGMKHPDPAKFRMEMFVELLAGCW